MKLSMARLLPLMLLATSAVACASETSDNGTAGDEDDITSLTARARKLQFAGYVYVDEGAPDYAIQSAIKQQTQSAFGALREANVGVNSRELKDVDPSTFLKTPVSVVDTANRSAPAKKMTKVAYTFTDDALVPIPMARRTSIPLGLLGKNYQMQSARIVQECTNGDAHAHEFQNSVWYVFDPSLSNCKQAMSAEATKVDNDRRGLAAGQVPLSEVERLYLPMTARLKPTTTQTTNKFPEYDRLYAGGVEPGKLVIGMVSGMMADWAAGEHHEVFEDEGYNMWYGGIREIFKARPGMKITGVEGVQDPLTYKLGQTTVKFGAFEEMIAFELDNRNPAGVTQANRNDLRKLIATTLMKKFVTFEAQTKVTVAGAEKPLTIKLQTYFGAETDSTPHKRAIKTSDIFVYNGHSYIGYGPLDPSRFTSSDFPSSYQVLMINGCVSYNYYEKDYKPLKQGGTQNLDLVTNGLESWVNESGPAMGRFVGAFIDGKINNYEAILKAAQFTYFGYDWGNDALRVVDGEADNKFDPTRTPITLR